MGPKFKLRLNRCPQPTRIRNKAGTAIDRKITDKRNEEIEEAVKYCQENGVNGHAALKTNLFPNIKDKGIIDRRLKGKVKHGCERDYCRILTVEEERTLVEYIKNRNRSYQPMNRKDVSELIFNILRIRQFNNKKVGYRNCTPLSTNAKSALARGSLGRRYWTRFNAAHSDLSIKRKGNVSINRALNCTREMAEKHINELAEELMKADIFKDATMQKSGVWSGEIDASRIYNHDETPQFIQYGIDGTPSGLYYAGKGETCQKLIKENRECVTIQPFVSFDGEMAMCQVIFAGKSITSNMVPDGVCEKIKHLLISTTENGVQTAKSLLEAYKLFDKYLTERGVERPVVVISDGHSSRFDYDLLSFLDNAKILLFLSPPDTTGLLQLLDQINQMLHRCYKDCKEDMFTLLSSINREGFMLILAEVWNKWASKQAIVNAAKKVGVTPKELSIEFMQKDKFEKAEKMLKPTETPAAPLTFSPKGKRKGSKDYFKEKAERLERELKRVRGSGIDLEQVPGLLAMTKVKKPKLSSEKIRVTQVFGSMEGKKVKELVQEIKQKKKDAEIRKEEKTKEKQEGKDAFIRCKTECVCKKKVCAASGFRQCPKCLNILRSVCSKVACQDDGKKPKMILPAAAPTSSGCKKSKMPTVRSFEESESEESSEGEFEDKDETDDLISDEEAEEEPMDVDVDEKIRIDEEDIGMYYAIEWLQPRGYYWAKLDLVFADDVDEDVNSAKFTFMQRKRLSANPCDIRYDWPKEPEEDIVSVDRVFFGPTKPTVDKSLLKFECEKKVSDIFKQM